MNFVIYPKKRRHIPRRLDSKKIVGGMMEEACQAINPGDHAREKRVWKLTMIVVSSF